jgi:hypothetical protein
MILQPFLRARGEHAGRLSPFPPVRCLLACCALLACVYRCVHRVSAKVVRFLLCEWIGHHVGLPGVGSALVTAADYQMAWDSGPRVEWHMWGFLF